MSITNLQPGDIYKLKNTENPDIFIQVGVGTDCGIFLGDWRDIMNKNPEFRVVVNQKDLRRNWAKISHVDCTIIMNEYAVYSEREIGKDEYFKVTLDDLNNRIVIGQSEFMEIEPLAVWETSHILNRLGRSRASDG